MLDGYGSQEGIGLGLRVDSLLWLRAEVEEVLKTG